MIRNLLRTLKERPILGIILCVAISEILQFVLTLFFDVTPTLYYGITVIALLILFGIPVILYLQQKNRHGKSGDDMV